VFDKTRLGAQFAALVGVVLGGFTQAPGQVFNGQTLRQALPDTHAVAAISAPLFLLVWVKSPKLVKVGVKHTYMFFSVSFFKVSFGTPAGLVRVGLLGLRGW